MRKAIIQSKLKLKLKDEHVTISGKSGLRIIPPPPAITAAKRFSFSTFSLQRTGTAGTTSISRCSG